MKVAFYAPLNPPDAPVPSGDRLIARMLLQALTVHGHEPKVVSRLRSLDMNGDAARQARIQRIGERQAERLLRRMRRPGAWRPDLWLTYHLYHKAPDWIGPAVADGLRIPYVVGEASYAKKHEQGPFASGLAAVARALGRADMVLGLKPGDEGGVLPRLRSDASYQPIVPFLDVRPFARAHGDRLAHRQALAACRGIDPNVPWLLTVGMMREGSKLASYRTLVGALERLGDRRWQLLVAGNGPAEAAVHRELVRLGARVTLLGCVEGEPLAQLYAASDLFVWPAIKEPIGMVFLEAQAAGLPLIAADRAGVGSVSEPGRTACLVPEGDEVAFAHAVAELIDAPGVRANMSRAAVAYAQRRHDVTTAGREFADVLASFVAARAGETG